MSDFDLAGAQKAGYSDTAIADHLAAQNNFDIKGARAAGYSDAEILSHLGTSAPAPVSSEDPGLSATPPVSGANPIDSALHVGARALQAARESIYKTLSGPANGMMWLGKKAGVVPEDAPSPEAGPTVFDKEPQGPAEKTAAYIGGAAGDVASTVLPFGFGLKVASKAAPLAVRGGVTVADNAPTVGRGIAESLAAKPGVQTALSAAGNAAAPEIQGSDLPEFAKPYAQMAVPFALGGLAHAGQRAVSAAPAATTQEAERRALLDYGQSIGGKNTAGKIMDSKRMQTLESVNSQLPLPYVGGSTARTEAANRNAFQTEALRKAGDTSGATAAPPSVTQEVRAKVGDKFGFLTRALDMKVGPEFGEDLAKARGDISKQLETQMPPSILKNLDELEAAAKTPDKGTLSGETYQNIRSKLGGMLNSASGTDKQAIGKMIDALDNVAERNMPKENFQDLKDARQQWRNLLALEKAVGSANNPETAAGNIPTAAYMRASRGNPDIEKLGRYGATFVGDKIPNSHTAPRAAFGHLGAGVGGLAFGAWQGMEHAPGPTMAAAAASTLPFAFQAAMNNPATRALLLARLRNPSNSLIGGPTFGALAGQQALKQGQ